MQTGNSYFVFLLVPFLPVFSSPQFVASSSNWDWGSSSFLASSICLGLKKLGWLVEDRSLAHILSVITTLFCSSVIRCKSRQQHTFCHFHMIPNSQHKTTQHLVNPEREDCCTVCNNPKNIKPAIKGRVMWNLQMGKYSSFFIFLDKLYYFPQSLVVLGQEENKNTDSYFM